MMLLGLPFAISADILHAAFVFRYYDMSAIAFSFIRVRRRRYC